MNYLTVNDLWVRYTTIKRYFFVQEEFIDGYSEKALVVLAWDGSLLDYGTALREGCPTLAQGLFKLGLLTPEIEGRLEVTISSTEKIEWTRELDIQTEASQDC